MSFGCFPDARRVISCYHTLLREQDTIVTPAACICQNKVLMMLFANLTNLNEGCSVADLFSRTNKFFPDCLLCFFADFLKGWHGEDSGYRHIRFLRGFLHLLGYPESFVVNFLFLRLYKYICQQSLVQTYKPIFMFVYWGGLQWSIYRSIENTSPGVIDFVHIIEHADAFNLFSCILQNTASSSHKNRLLIVSDWI